MTTAHQDSQTTQPAVSGWAAGGLTFAATVMVLIGCFQLVVGITALVNDEFFVVTRNYTFDLDVTGWGWIHLVFGIVLLATGFGLFARAAWAGVAAIVFAMLNTIANFFFIPYYPIWALVSMGLGIWVIWALTRPGAIRT